MSLLRIVASRTSTITHRLTPSTTASSRLYATLRPLLISGYGRNPPSKSDPSKSNTLDPIVGGEIPNYTGPSIAEKKKAAPVDVDQEKAERMTKKMKKEFNDTMYQERDASGKMAKKGTQVVQSGMKENVGQSKRYLITTPIRRLDGMPASPFDDNPTMNEDLKTDAHRLKQNTQNKLHKAKLAAEDISIDVKEGAQQMAASAKKAAHRVADSVKSAATSVKHAAEVAATPVYVDDDRNLYTPKPIVDETETMAPHDVNQQSNTWVPPPDDLSESGNARSGYKLPLASTPESAAAGSGATIGADMDSVRRSVLDGPQEMPQGKGKRARDEKGRPMETGTEGS